MSASATLIWGAPIKDLVKKETTVYDATRYHPVTGKPFTAKLSKTVWSLCGREIEEPAEDPFQYPGELLGQFKDLDYTHHGGEYTDRETYIVGCPVSKSSNTDKSPIDVTPEDIEQTKAKAVKTLTALGYTGDIKLYLCAYVSY